MNLETELTELEIMNAEFVIKVLDVSSETDGYGTPRCTSWCVDKKTHLSGYDFDTSYFVRAYLLNAYYPNNAFDETECDCN